MTEFSRAVYAGYSHYSRPIYALKADGTLVGELKYVYRPKNAGGMAWQAKLFLASAPHTVFHSNEKKALADFKKMFEDCVGRGEKLHAQPERCALLGDLVYYNGKLVNSAPRAAAE